MFSYRIQVYCAFMFIPMSPLLKAILKFCTTNHLFISGSAEGAGGETPSEPYVAICDAHANEVALFHAKVLKIFHEKKITALWKETLSFFNISTCEYVIIRTC